MSQSDVSDVQRQILKLDSELRRLARSNRRWRCSVLSLVGLVLLLAGAGAASGLGPMEVDRLVLKDKDNRPRVVLELDEGGHPALTFLTPDGRKRLVIGNRNKDSYGLYASDDDGISRASIATFGRSGAVWIVGGENENENMRMVRLSIGLGNEGLTYHEGKKVRLVLGKSEHSMLGLTLPEHEKFGSGGLAVGQDPNGSVGMTIGDGLSKDRGTFCLTKEGLMNLKFWDADEKPRIGVETNSKGRSSISILDSDGQIVKKLDDEKP